MEDYRKKYTSVSQLPIHRNLAFHENSKLNKFKQVKIIFIYSILIMLIIFNLKLEIIMLKIGHQLSKKNNMKSKD
jgi:hypothetical protein